MVIFVFCLWWPAQGFTQDSSLLFPHPNQLSSLSDDMDRQSLITAATRHLGYLNKLSPETVVQLDQDSCNKECLLQSMATFLKILKQEPSPTELALAIQQNFHIYQTAGREKGRKGEMLITGYYEPIMEGSLRKGEPFIHPLYSPPESLINYRDPVSCKKTTGRQHPGGQKIPFWSRAEIEEGKLLAGNELVYLKDQMDAFTLHIQGSGKIRLPDGSLRALQFAATNGHQYKSIGKLLVDEKKMSAAETTMPSIRQYLRQNPQEQKRILHHNPRYVFFQWNAKKETPIGSIGLPLTAGRSMAVDPATLPTGLMAYMVSQKPVLDEAGRLLRWEPMHRFVLPQDAGAAIKGAGRADLFWGNGHYAEIAAGNMKEQGQLYFLVQKDMTTKTQNATLAVRPSLP